MDKSVIRLSVAKNKFWLKYLEVIDPVLRLKARERDVLACILMIAIGNKSNPKIEEKLLDYNSRVKIRDFTKMSEASLNNNISELKKKGFIIKTDKGFRVHPNFLEVEYDTNHSIEFKLNIK